MNSKFLLIDGWFFASEKEFVATTSESALLDAIATYGKHNVIAYDDGFFIVDAPTKSAQGEISSDALFTADKFYADALKRAEADRDKRQAEIDAGFAKFAGVFGEALASAIKPQPAQIVPPVKFEVDGVWTKTVIVDEQLKIEIEKLKIEAKSIAVEKASKK